MPVKKLNTDETKKPDEKKPVAKLTEKEFQQAMTEKLADRGISRDWMKKHLIITKI